MTRPDAQAPLVEWALWYASELRWPVFPLAPRSKTPAVPKTEGGRGFHDATTDPQQIKAWWKRWPDANIGLPTGERSNTMIFDVDMKEWEGKRGDQTLTMLEVEHQPLPRTLKMQTWSGSYQLFFNDHADVVNRTNAFGPWLDSRSRGGYTILPPSCITEGERSGQYRWENDPASPRAAVPEWLLKVHRQIVQANGQQPRIASKGEGIPNGSRNATLHSLGRALHAKNLSEKSIREALVAFNANECNPPFTPTELEPIIRQAINEKDRPDFTPAEKLPVPDTGGTDLAYAKELAATAGAHLRYCTDQSQWFTYDGARWVPGTEDQVVPYVTEMAKSRYRKAGEAADGEARKQLVKAGRRLETISAVRQIIGMAQTLPQLQAETGDFNHDVYLLNVENGTLDLKTGKLRPHNREDLLTRIIPVKYDPQAEAPTFAAFLHTIFDGNEGLMSFVQRAVGYSLTGSVQEQVFFLCWGEGSNGKSTLFNLLLHLLGDYAAKMSASTLLAKRGGLDSAAMNDIATLQGARFVSTVESDMGRRLAEAQVKELTGGDPIKVKRLYKDVFTIEPTWKIWVATNHQPIIRGRDHAMWRRVRLVPFTVTIPDAEQDTSLPDRLLAELPGVLRWAVEGCVAWQRDGLGLPKEVKAATEEYKERMDDLADYIAECCVTEPGAWCSMESLYGSFTAWAKESGEFIWSKRAFGDRLSEAGFPPQHSKDKTTRGRSGVRLRRFNEPLPDAAMRPNQETPTRQNFQAGLSQPDAKMRPELGGWEAIGPSKAVFSDCAEDASETAIDIDAALETYRRNYQEGD